MAPRALWKGQLRLSLVSIPVEIFSATKTSSKVSFRQIHKPSGKRVRYEKSVPGIGPVKAEDIVKGYEVGSDEYILLDPDEVDEIKLTSPPPTIWRRMPTAWCATRCASRARLVWVRSLCAARNIWPASNPAAMGC